MVLFVMNKDKSRYPFVVFVWGGGTHTLKRLGRFFTKFNNCCCSLLSNTLGVKKIYLDLLKDNNFQKLKRQLLDVLTFNCFNASL